MDSFQGDKKASQNFLWNHEQELAAWLLPKIPRWIEGYHLTLMTIVWGVAMVLFFYLARADLRWVWGTVVLIIAQYFTDLLDGALGRARDTGIPKWGYYMDHLLDYGFLCAVVTGYVVLMPAYAFSLMVLLAIFGGFMVQSYLLFGTEGAFEASVYGIGGTEWRLYVIALNIYLFFAGKDAFGVLLPFLIAFWGGGLLLVVYRAQRRLWLREMGAKTSRALTEAAHEEAQQPEYKGGVKEYNPKRKRIEAVG